MIRLFGETRGRQVLMMLALLWCVAVARADDGAFGWVTCSDETGTPYVLDGGWRNSEPTMKVLYASGGDDREMISRAIKKYDIVVLDGSKGDFVVSSLISFNHLKNKSILGRHQARLCTQWYITPEFRQMLVEANLDGLSSSSGTGGTLSNGIEVDEEREWKTRQTIIDYTHDSTEAYRKSGIFQFSQYDENIIIRNLSFIGPGSVDVGGSSLIINLGSRIWVDHCEFVDGIDGNIDNCGFMDGTQYVTYSWNVFRYTERSINHSYTNLIGWHHSYMQYVTLAFNLWREGCVRRMPLAELCHLHLLNNYYNCPGNGDVVVFRGNTHARMEGNYAIDGLKYPFKCSASDYYVSHDNIGFSQYNEASNTDESMAVPYSYQKLAAADVPAVLTGELGAGPTLPDDYFQLPPETEEPQNVVSYAVSKKETFAAGTVVEKENITLTIGQRGSHDYGEAVGQSMENNMDLFYYYCPGNEVNGDQEGGTCYELAPAKNGTLTVGLKINANKKFYILEDGVALEDFNGIKHAESYVGTYTFPVKAGKTYKLYCASSKLCFYGFIYQWDEDATDISRPDVAEPRHRWYTLDGWPLDDQPQIRGVYLYGKKKVVVK